MQEQLASLQSENATQSENIEKLIGMMRELSNDVTMRYENLDTLLRTVERLGERLEEMKGKSEGAQEKGRRRIGW